MKLVKFGLLVNDLGINQLCYQFIRNYNNYLLEKDDVDAILYYRNLGLFPGVQPHFAIMNMYEAYRNNDVLIGTDLNGANRILEWFTPSRYFYVWDLEWFHIPQKSFEQLSGIYNNPNLKILARSDQHAKILELSWGSKIAGIVHDTNIEDFAKIIRGEK